VNCYKCATPIPDNSRFCSACGADVSGDSHDHVGDTIPVDQDSELFNKLQTELGDEYVLERELGRGGMAVVYLGHDSRLNRKIAVKLLPPELTYSSTSMVERFKREAQTAARLDHPNIIPVYRVAPGGKLFWYVMKYLDGQPLDDILEAEGQLDVARTVDVVSQTAAALDYAHQNKVVHRDVKPANIVVDRKGWVTVTDFGIAKALDANTLTASGSIIGTPYYMSPEQCKGKKVGPAADQYSLAVMTYQMLGGHLPFTGDSAVEIVHKHVADPVPPLGVLRPNLSQKVIAVVERGLAKNAEERFATVAEFAAALKAAAQGLDITLAPPGKVAPVRMSKTALVSPVPGALRTARGTWRERKGLVFGTLGGLVVAAGIAGALVLRPWEPKVMPPQTEPPSGQQLANGPAPGSQQLPAGAPADTAVARRDTAPATVAAAPPPANTPPNRRETSPRTQRPAVGAPDRQAAQANRSPAPENRPAAPGVQQQSAQPAGQPTQQSAPPASAPASQPPVAQPPAAAAQPTTGFLSLGTQPVSTIYVNGAPRGSRLAHLEVPAGTVHLRFQVQDSTGIWWGPDRDVAVAPGENKVLGYIRLVRP
jgi:serine/threonine-protein kinase